MAATGSDFVLFERERTELLEHYRKAKQKQAASETHSKAQVLLVQGKAGTGKTTLVQSLKSNVSDDGGIFIQIAFDSFPDSDPFNDVTNGLSQWVREVEDAGKESQNSIRHLIRENMTNELTELFRSIPPIKHLFDQGDNASDRPRLSYGRRPSESSISAAVINRYSYLFKSLVVALCSSTKPVVLFLDDLDFANAVAQDLLASIVQQASVPAPFIIITTYELEEKLEQFQIKWGGLKRLVLDEMNETTTNELAKQLIWEGTSTDQWKVVSDHAYFEATGGNLFFTNRLCKEWCESGLGSVSEENDTVDRAKTLLLNRSSYTTTKLELLPVEAQEMLRIASCIGSRIDKCILGHLLPDSSLVDAYLAAAVDAGLVTRRHGDTHFFSHTCIYKAVYATIGSEELESFHRRIGRKLWKSFDLDMLDEYIFLVAELLVKGVDAATSQKEKYAVAKLCVHAGEKAASACSFRRAYFFLQNGISLLPDSKWQDEQKLCVRLYSGAAEVAYSMGLLGDVTEFVDEAIQNVKSTEDLRRVQLTKLYTLATSGAVCEALAFGSSLLEGIGINLPSNPTAAGIFFCLKRITRRLQGKSDEMLLRLPTMGDSEKLAAMQIMSNIFIYGCLVKRDLPPFIAEAMISLTLEHGLSNMAALGFVLYGQILISRGIDIDRGYRYGMLGVCLCKLVTSISLDGRQLFVSLSTGYPTNTSAGNSPMKLHGQELNLLFAQPSLVMWANLSNRTDGVFEYIRKIMLSRQEFERMKEICVGIFLWYHYATLAILYVLGDSEDGYDNHAKHCEPLLLNHSAFGDFSVVAFYYGLTCVEVASKRPKQKRHLLRKAKKCLDQLRSWSAHSPGNFLGKTFLLEAELLALNGKHGEAHQKYAAALSMSKEAGFYLGSALAHERMGRWRIRQNNVEDGVKLFQAARKIYDEFGADAKVNLLSEEIQRLAKDSYTSLATSSMSLGLVGDVSQL